MCEARLKLGKCQLFWGVFLIVLLKYMHKVFQLYLMLRASWVVESLT